MARTRMVTRTINVSEVIALTVDVTTSKVYNISYELTGNTYTNDTALKAIKKVYETDTTKIVSIVAITEREELYGMLETDFLKSAKKLDNETRKFLEEDTDEEPIEEEPTVEATEDTKNSKGRK